MKKIWQEFIDCSLYVSETLKWSIENSLRPQWVKFAQYIVRQDDLRNILDRTKSQRFLQALEFCFRYSKNSANHQEIEMIILTACKHSIRGFDVISI